MWVDMLCTVEYRGSNLGSSMWTELGCWWTGEERLRCQVSINTFFPPHNYVDNAQVCINRIRACDSRQRHADAKLQ